MRNNHTQELVVHYSQNTTAESTLFRDCRRALPDNAIVQ
jgi:methylphosphotriester-DNA--protein-cysteine methyltransferase